MSVNFRRCRMVGNQISLQIVLSGNLALGRDGTCWGLTTVLAGCKIEVAVRGQAVQDIVGRFPECVQCPPLT